MLVVNPSKRFSARDVLNHPWMKLPVKSVLEKKEEVNTITKDQLNLDGKQQQECDV
jgi:hypothetical protein